MQKSPRYPIGSVDRALQLLVLLGDESTIRLSDVAQRIGVAHSTAHRLLETLVHRGFAEQDSGTRAYRAGPALLQLGAAALRRADLRSLLRPTLEVLAGRLDETVHLGIRQGSSVRYVDAVESTRALRVVARTGRSLPAHCTSTGKVLLAEMDATALRELYSDGLPRGETVRSIVDLHALINELTDTRRRGWAINVGESEDGVVSVAVPVRGRTGETVASVSCAAPRSRLKPEVASDIAQVLAKQVAQAPPPSPIA